MGMKIFGRQLRGSKFSTVYLLRGMEYFADDEVCIIRGQFISLNHNVFDTKGVRKSSFMETRNEVIFFIKMQIEIGLK